MGYIMDDSQRALSTTSRVVFYRQSHFPSKNCENDTAKRDALKFPSKTLQATSVKQMASQSIAVCV